MSPRAWGCTAYVQLLSRALLQCPHVRGGVPCGQGRSDTSISMSPRAWGCTADKAQLSALAHNVPTCVGVYRSRNRFIEEYMKCPHVRGDVPSGKEAGQSLKTMSPRAWGCTVKHETARASLLNVPTCVGVYRWHLFRLACPAQCPHVRGGVPSTSVGGVSRFQMSPRAWGYTVEPMASGALCYNIPHVRGGVPEAK